MRPEERSCGKEKGLTRRVKSKLATNRQMEEHDAVRRCERRESQRTRRDEPWRKQQRTRSAI
jgi:hypothetical protein